MAWQDRPYYRDRDGSTGNPLMWLLTGSVPLFTVFGIRVRAHASLLLLVFLVLLLGLGQGSTVVMRVQSMVVLFCVILLHEFGHCFAARLTGGEAEEILMTPLGGLAMAMAKKRPWPTFVTVAGGPLVNVLICAICWAAIFAIDRQHTLIPTQMYVPRTGWFTLYNWLYWIYGISLALLLFNLIPVFPMDGGQLLQSILWKPMGYYKSMLLTVNIGLVGSVVMFMVGIATFGSVIGGVLMMFIAASCFLNCFQTRAMLRAEGPWGFQDEDSTGFDYSQSLRNDVAEPRKRKRNNRATRRALKLEQADQIERQRIDAILAKVSAHGMQSLTWLEKRALHKATEHQRERDSEIKSLREG